MLALSNRQNKVRCEPNAYVEDILQPKSSLPRDQRRKSSTKCLFGLGAASIEEIGDKVAKTAESKKVRLSKSQQH